MAEFSIFWTTGATGDGASPYTTAQITAWLRRTFAPGQANGGVLRGYGNELAVSGTSSPVTVGTGAAQVYGYPYENDSAVTVTIPTPSSATRIDWIVLRASWPAQTVRIAHVAGTEGGGAPSLTQMPGTVYDIPLARVSITTGGVITVTDQRVFCTFGTVLQTANLADSAVTVAKIADGAITTAKLASGVLSADTTGRAKMADGFVTTAKIVDGAISMAKLAANAVTNDKFRQSGACSVVGRSANSMGNVADISAGSNDTLLRRVSDALSFGVLTLDMIPDALITGAKLAANAVTNDKFRQSAGLSVVGRSANSTGNVADISAGTDGHVLRRSGTTLGFGQVATAGIADGAVTAAKIANRQRRFLVPAVFARNETDGTYLNWGDANAPGWNTPDNKRSTLVGGFLVPRDYVSGMYIYAVVLPQASGYLYCEHLFRSAKAEETFPQHGHTEFYTAAFVTNNRVQEIQAIGPATQLQYVEPDEYVMLRWARDATSAYDTINTTCRFLGWMVYYTADS